MWRWEFWCSAKSAPVRIKGPRKLFVGLLQGVRAYSMAWPTFIGGLNGLSNFFARLQDLLPVVLPD